MSINNLFQKIEDSFNSSKIKDRSIVNGWYYQLSFTSIENKMPVLLDFNPSALAGKSYLPQKNFPSGRNANFLLSQLENQNKKLIELLVEYFPLKNHSHFNHIPFCFFRSETENEICETDIKLCEPIFTDRSY